MEFLALEPEVGCGVWFVAHTKQSLILVSVLGSECKLAAYPVLGLGSEGGGGRPHATPVPWPDGQVSRVKGGAREVETLSQGHTAVMPRRELEPHGLHPGLGLWLWGARPCPFESSKSGLRHIFCNP